MSDDIDTSCMLQFRRKLSEKNDGCRSIHQLQKATSSYVLSKLVLYDILNSIVHVIPTLSPSAFDKLVLMFHQPNLYVYIQ